LRFSGQGVWLDENGIFPDPLQVGQRLVIDPLTSHP
jgi:hypothetical protein